ncbi:hypothetical protein HDU85_005197 [Gaertneriomyces sp. JEL0708]|nr:hypothetical protein HDU85_005197 [Gaertneriomyces sp. JEL0708]
MSRLLPRLWSDLSRDFASFEAPLANAADRFLYGRSPTSHAGALHPSNHIFRPATDIAETPQAYVIETELPGAKKEDVDVDVDGNTVTIRGRIDTTNTRTDGAAASTAGTTTSDDAHVDRSAAVAEEESSTSTSSSSAADHVNANPPAATYWTQERVIGTFQRSVTLPVVDAGTVKARFKNGLLSVIVPKTSGQTHANRIPISEE